MLLDQSVKISSAGISSQTINNVPNGGDVSITPRTESMILISNEISYIKNKIKEVII
jgi:hypothetical protein